jgi:coniferyl-aldehyde dehydrogenase
MERLFQAQRSAFAAAPTRRWPTESRACGALRDAVRKHAGSLAHAADRDFGGRAHAETMMVDVLPSVLHINHLLGGLGRWMRPSRRRVELLFLGNSARWCISRRAWLASWCPGTSPSIWRSGHWPPRWRQATDA